MLLKQFIQSVNINILLLRLKMNKIEFINSTYFAEKLMLKTSFYEEKSE